jgi:hypothetical protein
VIDVTGEHNSQWKGFFGHMNPFARNFCIALRS